MLQTATLTESAPHGLPPIRADHATRLAATLLRFANGGASAGAGLIRTWFQLHRQRRALAALDDRLLRDIGVTRPHAQREAGKPFFRLPARHGLPCEQTPDPRRFTFLRGTCGPAGR
jgi:uncharacterized protein YjiS (DUF1127 family)